MINNSLLPEHQRIDGKIILKWNNVGSLLTKQAEENPQKLFLIFPDENETELTYMEFKKIVDNVASMIVVSTLFSFITIPIVVFFALKYFN